MRYLILLLLSFPVCADEIILHTISYHVGQREFMKENGALNEINPGVAYKSSSNVIGMYYNSEKNLSVYVAKNTPFGDFSLDYGIVYGYKDHPLLPFVGATYNFENVAFTAIPSMTGEGKPMMLFHMMLKFEVK